LCASHPYSIPARADPGYLHPFPTRRSSDLDQAEQPEDLGPLIGDQHEGAVDIKRENDHGGREIADAEDKHRFLVARRVPAAAHLDRKSTRLNSSHVKISYAVFCLKQKVSDA